MLIEGEFAYNPSGLEFYLNIPVRISKVVYTCSICSRVISLQIRLISVADLKTQRHESYLKKFFLK
jgi:hypothetical protein